MSWKAYTNDHLVNTGKVTHAAIIGLEGEQKGAEWAASPDFKMADKDRHAVADMMNSPPEYPPPVELAGVGYTGIRWEDNTYMGRKRNDGCIIKKAGTCVIVAVYQAPIQLQDCLKEVERVAGYLGA